MSQKKRPHLKQFADLALQDFLEHPVWIGVHTVDYDEPWYDDTDEETFRPWTERLPVSAAEGMLLVRASFRLADGRTLPGFLTPPGPDEEASLGIIQPLLFLPNGQQLPFWFGMAKPDLSTLRSSLEAIPAAIPKVFPIRFRGERGLTEGVVSGQLDGFYYEDSQGKIVCET